MGETAKQQVWLARCIYNSEVGLMGGWEKVLKKYCHSNDSLHQLILPEPRFVKAAAGALTPPPCWWVLHHWPESMVASASRPGAFQCIDIGDNIKEGQPTAREVTWSQLSTIMNNYTKMACRLISAKSLSQNHYYYLRILFYNWCMWLEVIFALDDGSSPFNAKPMLDKFHVF